MVHLRGGGGIPGGVARTRHEVGEELHVDWGVAVHWLAPMGQAGEAGTERILEAGGEVAVGLVLVLVLLIRHGGGALRLPCLVRRHAVMLLTRPVAGSAWDLLVLLVLVLVLVLVLPARIACLNLRAELRGVTHLVAVAALLLEQCRADDSAVRTGFGLCEVRGVDRLILACSLARDTKWRLPARVACLNLRAELRGVAHLVAVATLLREKCRADDSAVRTGLRLREVRGVDRLGLAGGLADGAGHLGDGGRHI